MYKNQVSFLSIITIVENDRWRRGIERFKEEFTILFRFNIFRFNGGIMQDIEDDSPESMVVCSEKKKKKKPSVYPFHAKQNFWFNKTWITDRGDVQREMSIGTTTRGNSRRKTNVICLFEPSVLSPPLSIFSLRTFLKIGSCDRLNFDFDCSRELEREHSFSIFLLYETCAFVYHNLFSGCKINFNSIEKLTEEGIIGSNIYINK